MSGYVDEVSGRGAEEIHGFVPTRHELLQLVKYWEDVYLDYAMMWFFYATAGSDWLRKQSFARHRIGRIADILGDDEVNKAIDEVCSKMREQIGDRYWEIFISGDKAQREAVWEEEQKRVDEVFRSREEGTETP